MYIVYIVYEHVYDMDVVFEHYEQIFRDNTV